MKKAIILIAFTMAFVQGFSQQGLYRPKYIGWPTDSFQLLHLVWNPETFQTEWMESMGGGDSIVITEDSLCVIYLGDTICVGANTDSFYISGDTSLCVISMGDTLCSPYSAGGTTIYTGNGALTGARTVAMNGHYLKFDIGNSAFGDVKISNTYPTLALNGAFLPNDQSSLLQLAGTSPDGDVFMRFNGPAAVDYSFGVAKTSNTGPLTISEGEELGSTGRPMMQFYGVGDSIVMVNNLLAAGSGLRLRANTTAAASQTQKLLELNLNGANATTGQTTYGAYVSNAHSGTGATNYGVYSTATNGGSFNYGVYGTGAYRGVKGVSAGSSGVGVEGQATSTGTGVLGTATSGAAVQATSSSGYGILASTVSGSTVMLLNNVPSSTSTVVSIAQLTRATTGTPANGLGGSLDFYNSTTSGGTQLANNIISKMTNVTGASYESQLIITGATNSFVGDIIYLEGDKRVRFNGRAEEQQGAAVASVAGAIALGYDGNTFEITGTNAITLISNLGWQNGSVITLMFTSTATLTDGTANSGTDIGMELAGNANFGATADDVITLKLGEIGGVQRWREQSRTAN